MSHQLICDESAIDGLEARNALGYEPGGAPTWVDMIASDKFPYYDALDAADAADRQGVLDVSVMQDLVSGLLAKQLVSIVGDAGG